MTLDPAAATPDRSSTGTPSRQAPLNPVLAEFEAITSELLDVQQEVAQAYATRLRRRPAPASPPPPAPPPRELVETLTLSLQTHPEMIDHSLSPQPPEWPTPEDRSPCVPMTTEVALMMQAAERLDRGRVAIGVEKVVASSWLQVEPPVDVKITARRVDTDRIHVSLGSYARADVLMADRYPEPAAADDSPLSEAGPPSVRSGEDIYRNRLLFHGPSYQGIDNLKEIGRDGIRGRLRALPALGALLDAAGQIGGLWISWNTTIDRVGMPVRIARLDVFGPPPAPGELLDCTVRVRNVGAREVRVDIEVVQQGRLHARISGWEYWRFQLGGDFLPVLRFPARNLSSEPLQDGVVVLRDPGRPLASVDFLASRYLPAQERRDAKIARGRSYVEWVNGRIAAKDAVRRVLFDRGYDAIFPAQITIGAEESGRPTVAGPFEEDVRVSLAHTAGMAVAIAALGIDPGIDVEKIEPRSDGFASLAFLDEELALLPAGDRDEWQTRLWCAKEAVGKARGTGLDGAPLKLRLTRVDGERLLVEDRWVQTRRIDDFALAWTEQ